MDGSPVASTVRWFSGQLPSGSSKAEDGVIRLPQEDRYAVEVLADGYVPLRGVETLRDGRTLELIPEAVVRLEFAGGKQGETLEVLLAADADLGPGDAFQSVEALARDSVAFEQALEGGSSEARREVLADADYRGLRGPRLIVAGGQHGVLTFRGVAPDPASRWVLRTDRPVVMDPPHELPRVGFRPDGSIVNNARHPPERVSGTFVVSSGTTTIFRPSLPQPISIRGVAGEIDAGSRCSPSFVRLRRNVTYVNPAGGPDVATREQIESVHTQDGGLFRFDGVAPQDFIVQASWRCLAGDLEAPSVVFANAGVSVGELSYGEDGVVDLGRLKPHATEHSVGFRFVDSGGNRLRAQDVLADADATARIAVLGGRFLPWQHSVTEYVDVPLLESVRLIGLYPWTYSLDLLGESELGEALADGYVIVDAPDAPIEIDIRSSTTSEIPIVVAEAPVATVVVARMQGAGGAGSEPPRAYFSSSACGAVHQVDLYPSLEGLWVGAAVLPQAGYDVLALADDGAGGYSYAAEDVGVFEQTDGLVLQSLLAFDKRLAEWDPLDGGPGVALCFDLVNRVPLAGRAVDAGGNAVAGVELTFATDLSACQKVDAYRCVTAEDGSFEMSVHAGAKLYVQGCDAIVEAGSGNTSVVVTLHD